MVIRSFSLGHSKGGTGSQIILLRVLELRQPSYFLFIVDNSLLFVTLYSTRFLLNENDVIIFRFLVYITCSSEWAKAITFFSLFSLLILTDVQLSKKLFSNGFLFFYPTEWFYFFQTSKTFMLLTDV